MQLQGIAAVQHHLMRLLNRERRLRCTEQNTTAHPPLPGCPQRGGALVIRRLCGFMGSEAVFTELAGALQEEQDLVFAATMVQVRAGGLARPTHGADSRCRLEVQA